MLQRTEYSLNVASSFGFSIDDRLISGRYRPHQFLCILDGLLQSTELRDVFPDFLQSKHFSAEQLHKVLSPVPR